MTFAGGLTLVIAAGGMLVALDWLSGQRWARGVMVLVGFGLAGYTVAIVLAQMGWLL